MNIQSVKNNTTNHYPIMQNTSLFYYSQNAISFKADQNKKNIFSRGYAYIFGKDQLQPKIFQTKCSIIDNDLDYVIEVRSFAKNNYNKEEEKEFYNKLYNQFTTDKEKALFRQHFGKYLPQEQPQQTPSEPAQCSQNNNGINTINTKEPKIDNRSGNNSSSTNKNNTSDIQTKLKNESLTEQYSRLEKEFDELGDWSRENQDQKQSILKKMSILKRKINELDLSFTPVCTLTEEQSTTLNKKYHKLNDELGRLGAWTNENQDQKQAILDQMNAISKQMKEQNVSFIPQTNFSCGVENNEQFEKEKLEYITKMLCFMHNNEASVMEAFDMFDKYGSRIIYEGKSTEGTLGDLTIGTVQAFEECGKTANANKILIKYLDIFEKFASKNKLDKDASELSHVIRNCLDGMTKETIIKLIETLKVYAYEKDDALALSVRINKYPDLLQCVKQDELPEIKEHLNELIEITKDYPDLRPFFGEGSTL